MKVLKLPSVNVEFRKSKAKKNGKVPIYIRLAYDGKKKYISLNMYVHPSNWNSKQARVRPGAGNSIRTNNFIEQQTKRINEIILHQSEQLGNGIRRFNLDQIVSLFESNSDHIDFIKFAYKTIEQNKNKRTKGTYTIWIGKVRLLEQFVDHQKIAMDDITDFFLIDFYEWCKIELGHKYNTLKTTQNIIKGFINIAYKKGLIYKLPLEGMRHIKHKEPLVKDYLTEKEIHQLLSIYESKELNGRQQLSLQGFLFSCFTGLRYSDVARVNRTNFVFGELRIRMKKTQIDLTLPFSDMELAQRVLPVQPTELPYFFWPKNNPDHSESVNTHMRTILKKYGIAQDRKITFKSARDSFAIVSLIKGIPLKVISSFLGHTSIKTTEIYAKVVMDLKSKEIRKWSLRKETALSLSQKEIAAIIDELQASELPQNSPVISGLLEKLHEISDNNEPEIQPMKKVS